MNASGSNVCCLTSELHVIAVVASRVMTVREAGDSMTASGQQDF